MRPVYQRVLAVLTVFALGLLWVSCNASTRPEATVAPGQSTEDAGEETTSDEAVPPALRWRTRPGDDREAAVYQAINDELVASAVDFPTAYEPGAVTNYVDTLYTELAAGTAPDLFWIPGANVADFAQRGVLYDLRQLADATADFEQEAFYPGPMFHLTFNPETNAPNEALWGLPRDASTFGLYLNLDLIAESGAPDPRELAAQGEWNWDNFIVVATAVDNLGDDIFGYGEDAWWGAYGYWMGAAGGSFFTADLAGCNLAAAETLAGLDFQRRIYREFDVAVPWGEGADAPFLAGKVGMRLNGRWSVPNYRASADFNWDVVELPVGPGGTTNWHFWGVYVVNANVQNPQHAWELLRALTSTEAQLRVAELGANMPAHRTPEALEAFLSFTPPENAQAFLKGLADNPQTEGPLWQGSWPEYAEVMTPAVNAVLVGELSLEDFANTVCDEANKAFDS